ALRSDPPASSIAKNRVTPRALSKAEGPLTLYLPCRGENLAPHRGALNRLPDAAGQAGTEGVERFADAVAVGDGHGLPSLHQLEEAFPVQVWEILACLGLQRLAAGEEKPPVDASQETPTLGGIQPFLLIDQCET